MQKVLYFFGQLTDEDVEWMGKIGRLQRFSKDDIMVRRGEAFDGLGIILQGSYGVHVGDRMKEIALIGPGEIVGEISFVDSRPPTATVIAKENSSVCMISGGTLKARLDKEPQFCSRFYRGIAIFLADRFRSTTELLGQAEGKQASSGQDAAEELSDELMDNVCLAGDRFDRLLKRFSHEDSAR